MSEETTTIDKQSIKVWLESLLFINDKPSQIKELSEILQINKKDLEAIMEEFLIEYNNRQGGVCIVKVAGGYQMCTSAQSQAWIKKFQNHKRRQKLSMAALETLAIIAYKQPITKIEIENIRGVNADGVISNLFDLGLIKIGGRKEVIGRPFFYITTDQFLEYFGLNSIKDLPKLEDFTSLVNENMDIVSNEEYVNINNQPEQVQPIEVVNTQEDIIEQDNIEVDP